MCVCIAFSLPFVSPGMMDPLLCQDPTDNYIEPLYITERISWPGHLVMTTGRKQRERNREPQKNDGTIEDIKKVSVQKIIPATQNSSSHLFSVIYDMLVASIRHR